MAQRPRQPRAPRSPRPGSSRTGAPRPRRLAGSGPHEPVDEAAPAPAPAAAPEPVAEPASASLFASSRATRWLAAAFVVLLVAVPAEFVYWQYFSDSSVSSDAPSDAQPVSVPQSEFRPGVEAAAQSAEVILGSSHESYDEGIEDATALMTEEFATQYVETKEDVREEFIDARTTVEVRMLAQGVVRASPSQVQALLFFNQYVTKKGEQTSFSEYRALVTVVDTADGWLVSDIETQ